MKYRGFKAIVFAILLLSAISCSKIDWQEVWGGHPPLPKCDVAAYTLTIYPQVTHPFLFSKTYAAGGRMVSTIDASFFNLLPPEDLVRFRLKLSYSGRNLYLINLDNPSDTSMSVTMNRQGRPLSAVGNENLGSYEFIYTNNRLSAVKWGSIVFNCQYDAAGNIITLTYELDGDRVGYFYEYDYTRKAKYQFYMDEVRFLDNGFTLLQYLGLFPELTPLNLRTHTRHSIEGGLSIWDRHLINHKVDASGRLLSYSSAYYYDGKYDTSFHALLQWNCR